MMEALVIVGAIAFVCAAWVFAGWLNRRQHSGRCIYCGAPAGRPHRDGCDNGDRGW